MMRKFPNSLYLGHASYMCSTVDRPLKTAAVGGEALAGDPYPINKEQVNPANVLKEKKEKPLYDTIDIDLHYVKPTPPPPPAAMLGERVNGGGAQRRVPSIQGLSIINNPPPCCGGMAMQTIPSLQPPVLGAWARARLGLTRPCLV